MHSSSWTSRCGPLCLPAYLHMLMLRRMAKHGCCESVSMSRGKCCDSVTLSRSSKTTRTCKPAILPVKKGSHGSEGPMQKKNSIIEGVIY